MHRKEVGSFLRSIEKFRSERSQINGFIAPKSALMALQAKDQTDDSGVRFELDTGAIIECLRAECFEAAVYFAEMRMNDFNDIASAVGLSVTLVQSNYLERALSVAKSALESAVIEGALINYAAGNLVRQSLLSNDISVINNAIGALIDSTQVPRSSDCKLELDWIDSARSMGVDDETLDWISKVAEGG